MVFLNKAKPNETTASTTSTATTFSKAKSSNKI